MEIGTLTATAVPADAGFHQEGSMARPEIITYEKFLAALQDSGRSYQMDLIERAYHTADDLHRGVRRRSG